MKKIMPSGGLALLLTLVFLSPIAVIAQTSSTTEVRNFEVISVVGNQLVVRDELGTREITVPADFRFTVDGKSLAVSELKAGMKGTAAVTTTTTSRPVYVTEVKEGVVIQRRVTSVLVRDTGTGKAYHFNQKKIKDRGIQLFLDGKPAKLTDLDAGQKFTATIVTAGAPEVLTEKQVNAVLAQPDAPIEVVIASNAEAPPADAPAAAAAEPVAEPAAEPMAEPMAEPAAATEAAPAPAPAEEPSNLWMWLVLLVVLALVFWLIARRSKDKKQA